MGMLPPERSRPVLKEGFVYDRAGFVVGALVRGHDGWRFIGRVSGRKTSRKAHVTALKAIPRWARVMLKDGLSQTDNDPKLKGFNVVHDLRDFE